MPMEAQFTTKFTTARSLLIALAMLALGTSDVVHAQSSAPVVPTFQVQRYEVIGNTALDAEAINRAMRDATGTNINVPQIRRSLGKLQQAYRDRGFLKVALRLPQQPLTNGVVRVEVTQDPGSSAPVAANTLPAWTVPAYDVEHFEIRGNTALTPEQIDQILGPAAGASVNLAQLQKALAQLQTAYREHGYSEAAVTLPQQLLTDGRVVIQVNEGTLPVVQAEPAALANTPASPTPKFEVRRYEVAGNTLLPQATVDNAFTNAIGAEVSFEQIQKALAELQLAYRERGFATVSVALPQQQLTNAVVKVQVTEGRLVDVRVTGNQHFSSNNVLRALPSLHDVAAYGDAQLNSHIFQRELDLANQNRDRQIYPTLRPGPEPGTTALTLKVADRLPLHGRAEINNQNTPGTPDWRINTALSYANLWQLEHQLGLSYGFTPEAYKSGDQIPDYWLNRPLVANYGAYYRIPFGAPETITEAINNSGQFGYNEATRQFRLPPAGPRPDLTFYGSVSSSDTGTQFGEKKLVTQTPLLTIYSQDAGQDFTINEAVGSRFNFPCALSDTKRLNFSAGLDWKHYLLESYNTNNFLIRTVVTNSQGSQVLESLVSSPQPLRRNEVTYLPIALGADYAGTDKHGNFTASLGLSANVVGDPADFDASGYTKKVNPEYAKVTLALTREQKLPKNWSLLLRANGQAASGPLLSNEQFALGGLGSVRGYYEGDEYGDAGWFTSAELRTPYINSRVPAWSKFVHAWVRGSAFVDYGERYLYEAKDSRSSLLGVGFGLSANINNRLDMRLTLGWPLLDSANTTGHEPRATISIGGQF